MPRSVCGVVCGVCGVCGVTSGGVWRVWVVRVRQHGACATWLLHTRNPSPPALLFFSRLAAHHLACSAAAQPSAQPSCAAISRHCNLNHPTMSGKRRAEGRSVAVPRSKVRVTASQALEATVRHHVLAGLTADEVVAAVMAQHPDAGRLSDVKAHAEAEIEKACGAAAAASTAVMEATRTNSVLAAKMGLLLSKLTTTSQGLALYSSLQYLTGPVIELGQLVNHGRRFATTSRLAASAALAKACGVINRLPLRQADRLTAMETLTSARTAVEQVVASGKSIDTIAETWCDTFKAHQHDVAVRLNELGQQAADAVDDAAKLNSAMDQATCPVGQASMSIALAAAARIKTQQSLWAAWCDCDCGEDGHTDACLLAAPVNCLTDSRSDAKKAGSAAMFMKLLA